MAITHIDHELDFHFIAAIVEFYHAPLGVRKVHCGLPPQSYETMLRISLSAALLALVASSSAQNVVGDCADVYDTGTGYCQVKVLHISISHLGSIHKRHPQDSRNFVTPPLSRIQGLPERWTPGSVNMR